MVVNRKSNPNGQFLVINIDKDSLQKLKPLNMRPFLGCKRVIFKVQEGKESQSGYGFALSEDIGVALIQEPWTVKSKVIGMCAAKDKLI